MNINNSIRTVFNDKLKKGYLFSVDDIVNHLLEDDNMKDLDVGKLKTSVRAFISHNCNKTKIIKKLSDKRKISSSKKVYQKIKNSDVLSRNKYTFDLEISSDFFEKVFNNQIDVNKKYKLSEFLQIFIDIFGGEKLSKEKQRVIKQRIYSFINQYAKKGYIKKPSETPELVKLKDIDNGIVIDAEVPKEANQSVSKDDIDQEHSEDKLNDLLKKFSEMPMGELVKSFILYFNILQEKEKTQRKIIEDLENKIESIGKVNIDSLKEILKRREEKIIVLNKEVYCLKEKVKQLETDVNYQLDENERLLTINKELHSKIEEKEPEPTDAWKTVTVGDAFNL